MYEIIIKARVHGTIASSPLSVHNEKASPIGMAGTLFLCVAGKYAHRTVIHNATGSVTIAPRPSLLRTDDFNGPRTRWRSSTLAYSIATTTTPMTKNDIFSARLCFNRSFPAMYPWMMRMKISSERAPPSPPSLALSLRTS